MDRELRDVEVWGRITFHCASLLEDPVERAEFAADLVRFLERVGCVCSALSVGDAPVVQLIVHRLPAQSTPALMLLAFAELVRARRA